MRAVQIQLQHMYEFDAHVVEMTIHIITPLVHIVCLYHGQVHSKPGFVNSIALQTLYIFMLQISVKEIVKSAEMRVNRRSHRRVHVFINVAAPIYDRTN